MSFLCKSEQRNRALLYNSSSQSLELIADQFCHIDLGLIYDGSSRNDCSRCLSKDTPRASLLANGKWLRLRENGKEGNFDGSNLMSQRCDVVILPEISLGETSLVVLLANAVAVLVAVKQALCITGD